jgi:hypothetical protein
MAVVGVMEVAIHQVVHMVAVGYRLMTAIGPVYMSLQMPRTLMFGRAIFRICSRYPYYMLIDMIPMRVVQMPVMQIIDMLIMHNACMAALRAMWMRVILVLWQGTIGHLRSPLKDMELMRGNVQSGC